jgi:hypothetical protein
VANSKILTFAFSSNFNAVFVKKRKKRKYHLYGLWMPGQLKRLFFSIRNLKAKKGPKVQKFFIFGRYIEFKFFFQFLCKFVSLN